MKLPAAIKFFGSVTAVARVCDITPTAVLQWSKRGGIPYDKQCLIELEASRMGRKTYPKAARRDAPGKNGNIVQMV